MTGSVSKLEIQSSNWLNSEITLATIFKWIIAIVYAISFCLSLAILAKLWCFVIIILSISIVGWYIHAQFTKNSTILVLFRINQSLLMMASQLTVEDIKAVVKEAENESIILEKQAGNQRVFKLVSNNLEVKTPLIVPSLSSVRDEIKPYDHQLAIISSVTPPLCLVSAYDLSGHKIKEMNGITNHTLLLLDSGGYECKTSEILKPWDIDTYMRVISEMQSDIVISFDKPGLTFPDQLKENKRLLGNLRDRDGREFLFDYIFSELTAPIPEERSDTEKHPNSLLNRIIRVKHRITHSVKYQRYLYQLLNHINDAIVTCDIDIVGIPETCMGEDLPTRLNTLAALSEFIKETHPTTLIHIFGVGNPKHIIQYYRQGADIFDGTSWCRKLLFIRYDKDDNPVFEINNDIERYDSVALDCLCLVCDIKRDPKRHMEYNSELLLHNIVVYEQLREFLRTETLSKF